MMPEIWGLHVVGQLPDWVSAKDVVLEMLRRHRVDGGKGRIIEYHGRGLEQLSAMDRHVIANMGTELGATSTVFPSDRQTRAYLTRQGRGEDWAPLSADEGAGYDVDDELDLSELEPLIALPLSPDNVRPVREVAGQEIYQAYIGSPANPGHRDAAVVAAMVAGKRIPAGGSLDINPASRQMLDQLIDNGDLTALLRAGARLHQTGCNGCIGMGQAPAAGRRSLRTGPRNFPGRSGGTDDEVYLCSPETSAASALAGVITDPRTLEMPYPRITEPGAPASTLELLIPPPQDSTAELVKGPGHVLLPDFGPLGDELEVPLLLRLGDNVSTDEIMPAGAEGMSLWSSLPGMADHTFRPVDHSHARRARDTGDHAIMGGRNYGQGSSREQAALAPRSLGLRLVIAHSIARIHAENLVNFGILPLTTRDGAIRASCSPAPRSASAGSTQHCVTAPASWTCRSAATRSDASTRCPRGRQTSSSRAAASPGNAGSSAKREAKRRRAGPAQWQGITRPTAVMHPAQPGEPHQNVTSLAAG
jgi:aconitate hydratase